MFKAALHKLVKIPSPWLLACVCAAPLFCQAKVLGTYGTVYQITEPDLETVIKQTLEKDQQDGTIARIQSEGRDKIIQHIEHPDPVPGIVTATRSHAWLIDPTFTEKQPVVALNHTLIPKGFSYNPLQYGNLQHKYLFADARDPKQEALALKFLRDNLTNRVVLTGGSYADMSRKIHRQVFFDQGGNLTKRLGITEVPAFLSQDGLKLKIDVIAL